MIFTDDVVSARNHHVEMHQENKRKIYQWESESLITSLSCSSQYPIRIALANLGVVNHDYDSESKRSGNEIRILQLNADRHDQNIHQIGFADQHFPVTKILWAPRSFALNHGDNLFATSADKLRLWCYTSDNNAITSNETSQDIKPTEHIVGSDVGAGAGNIKLLHEFQQLGMTGCSPVTSFDWNEMDPSMILTSSTDAVCTLWDLRQGKRNGVTNSSDNFQSKTQNNIVAHDHEVYDVSFSSLGCGTEIFASVGGDGTLRLYDLRRLTHCIRIFKLAHDHDRQSISGSLVRVECNKLNTNLIATFELESSQIIVLDQRWPAKPLTKLCNHTGQLNGICWSPYSANHLTSCSHDQQALIWDLSKLPQTPIDKPVLAYKARGHINAIDWCKSNPNFISIGSESTLELLRV